MKLSREEENQLERWLITQLELIHQNNAETLSKYILSLLKQDRGNNESLKQFLHDELRTFLKEKTLEFSTLLFSALQDGSYKVVQIEDEDDNDDVDRRNSLEGGRRDRSGSDGDDSRTRGRLRRRYSDDGADRERERDRDQRERSDKEKDRDRSRERGGGGDSYRDNRDRNRGERDRWRDRNNNNYRNNQNRGYNNGDNRRNDQQHQNQHLSNDQQIPPWLAGAYHPGMNPPPYPPPYPWNPSAPAGVPGPPFYPPFNPYGAPFPPPYPPYNPFPPSDTSGNPIYNQPTAFPHPQVVENIDSSNNLESNDSNADKSSNVVPNTEQDATNEKSVNSENRTSYEDDLIAQNQQPSTTGPSLYPPMWGYDTNYMTYGQQYNNANNFEGHHNYNNNNNHNNSNNMNSDRYGNRNNTRNDNSRKQNRHNPNGNNKVQLPENERCTLRCTGIPTYVKEEDIRAHFEAFGHIVKLEISPMEDHNNNNNKESQEEQTSPDGASAPTEKKKTYNECLVQFYSPANAKKCLTSQAPVLNNRFIRIYQSNFNIILPSDVEQPSYEIVERDKALLTQDIEPKAYDAQKRKAASATTHTVGVTNKWRRTEPKASNASESVDGSENVASKDDAADGGNAAQSLMAPSSAKKEEVELKQEFEQLQTLKLQAEDILKKKEKLLLESVGKCRDMMEKLETSEDSETKASLLQNLENKIVDLQAQLRTVREQLDKGFTGAETSTKPVNPVGFRGGGRTPFYVGGRAAAYARSGFVAGGGRGRGYGRMQNKFVNPNVFQNAAAVGAGNLFIPTASKNPFQQTTNESESNDVDA